MNKTIIKLPCKFFVLFLYMLKIYASFYYFCVLNRNDLTIKLFKKRNVLVIKMFFAIRLNVTYIYLIHCHSHCNILFLLFRNLIISHGTLNGILIIYVSVLKRKRACRELFLFHVRREINLQLKPFLFIYFCSNSIGI